MSTTEVNQILAQLRHEREQTLAALSGISREELRYATGHERWSSARRVMLRLGDHLREHALQLRLIREHTETAANEPQAMLAMAEQAWGEVLASCVGLTDDDLDKSSGPGEWSLRQTFNHMISTERAYRQMVLKAQQDKQLAAGE
jgi:hypothetical protein